MAVDWKQGLRELLDTGPFPSRVAILYRLALAIAVLIGTALRLLATVQGFMASTEGIGAALEALVILLLAIDLLLNAAHAVLTRPEGNGPARALLRHFARPLGIIDLVAVVPYFVAHAIGHGGDWYTVLGVMRIFKLARYSPALGMLQSVLSRESRPLRSAVLIMLLLILSFSTAMWLIERDTNSEFANIPSAMWWAVVTLTTLGYGDVTPHSAAGRVLGGFAAVFGVGMFALPASILATGFAEEIRRRDFLHTWGMVAKVPFFSGLDAEEIAAITRLLRYMVGAQGDVLIRAGDLGDRMYFIVSGLVSVEFGGGRTKAMLEDGDFFGEIALLHQGKRTATVTAVSRCQLLALDIRDFRQFLARSPHATRTIARIARERLAEQGLELDEVSLQSNAPAESDKA